MAEYTAEETLVIEVGSEYVSKSKPYKVKSKIGKKIQGIKKIVIGKGISSISESAFVDCASLCEVAVRI